MSGTIDHVWNFVVKVPMGEQKSVLTLKSDANTLTGKMDSEVYGVQEIQEGTLEGNTLSWKTQVTKPMKLTLSYTAEMDDDKNISGIVKVGPMAKMKFSGTLA